MIAADVFALNPAPTVEHRRVGNGRHTVVIVDDFYLDPDGVRDLAAEVEFQTGREVVQNFPGERSMEAAETGHLLEAVCRYAENTQDLEYDRIPLCFSRSWGTRQLTPSQRLPHVDPTIAALVYLNRPEHCSGGTALYRHRGTGFEVIPLIPTREVATLAQQLGYGLSDLQTPERYAELLTRIFFDPRFAHEDNRTINEGGPYWELLELVEMRYNRLVIYDGRIPHSPWVDPGTFLETPRLCQLLSISLDQ